MMSKKNYLKPELLVTNLGTEAALLDGIGFGSDNQEAGAKKHTYSGKSTRYDNWADESNRQYPHSPWDD